MSHYEVIVIGASAGGVVAVQTILSHLTSEMQIPMVVVQHRSRINRAELGSVYSVPDGRKIVEVEDKMPLTKGLIYFATPDYHLLIEKDRSISLSQDELVHYSRPSIDVAFSSTALRFGPRTVGILLTGANRDGAAGLRDIQQVGGLTVVQDPQEAVSDTMPKAALAIMQPSRILRIAEIGRFLNQLGTDAVVENS
jgi:two-component system chemotaxis response regulator CheB